MKLLQKAKKFNKEFLLKYKPPAKAKWLTLWPTIKTTKNSTQVVLPVLPILLGIIVTTVLLAWLLLTKQSTPNNTIDNSALAAIGEVIELPNEAPQIAIVSDKHLLTQDFFEQAENGDYVIAYQKAGKVLLYRPSTKKVINFANLSVPVSETNTMTRGN